MTWKGFLIVLGLLSLQTAKAASVSRTYYDISVLNYPGQEANVVLVLELKPNVEKALVRLDPKTDALIADLAFNIEARIPGSRRTLHSWNFRHAFRQGTDGAVGLIGRFPLRLDPGLYEFHCELMDLRDNRRFFEILKFECRAPKQSIEVSDLAIQAVSSFGPVSVVQELHGDRVESPPDSIRFSTKLNAGMPASLAVRAILYRRQEEGQGRESQQGKVQVEHYRTYLQFSEVLHVKAGLQTFSGVFPLADAQDGQYRVELAFYLEDERIAQTVRGFTLEWSGMREVFENLDRAVEWMRWVAPEEEMARLKSIRDSDEKHREFVSWWQKRCRPGSSDASAAIKHYFSRIFLARQTILDEAEGWNTDRGRTLVHFGPPDLKTDITFARRKSTIWVYRKWNLAFLFQESGGNMILVRT